ncbi:hypothetical protein DM01DRAFT_1080436 [Hesseltinella vesiculosa]|uniref:Uncharacterized protein n=1 Tax=Hesseltinella vesiculosa TaxID=101127 RepID=A0A1X2GDV1_9FUNG|nr:hypothetical protein DM01DRAFT_1080436 [Hesseltinella vesiculosa]
MNLQGSSHPNFLAILVPSKLNWLQNLVPSLCCLRRPLVLLTRIQSNVLWTIWQPATTILQMNTSRPNSKRTYDF